MNAIKLKNKVFLLVVFLWIFFIYFTLSLKSASYSTAVVRSPVLSVYSQPSMSSEQVTQVLFNDRVWVIENQGTWSKVLIPDQYRDPSGYPGWVFTSQIKVVKSYQTQGGSWAVIKRTSANFMKKPSFNSSGIKVYFGSFFRYLGYEEDKVNRKSNGQPYYWLHCRTQDGEEGWVLYDHAVVRRRYPFPAEEDGSALVRTAYNFQGSPYLWGGMTCRGIDCSGLTFMVYRYYGYVIPRDADQQFQVGRRVEISALQPGDLLFWGNGGTATHVGIYAGNQWFIQSGSQGVVLETFSPHASFMGARRIFR